VKGAVWIADWPATAAELAGEIPAGAPAAVAGPGRVVSANAWARAHGVHEGMRRRSVRAVCPQATVLPVDRQRDAVRFEPILRAIDAHVAHVDVLEAGTAMFAARGAVRTAGSPEALAEALIGEIADGTGCEAHVGIAKGTLAALVAARSDLLLDEEDSHAMLRAQRTRTLLLAAGACPRGRMEECVELLERLGADTLGKVLDVGAAALTTRFGRIGQTIWSLASGRDAHIAVRRETAAELMCGRVFEPPVERAEEAVFAVRPLAAELAAAMGRRSLSGGRLRIGAFMEDGREFGRTWTVDGGRARDILDRVRWQLAGWIGASRQRSGLARIELRIDQTVEAGERPDPLWGARAAGDEQVGRAVTRLQALLGEGAVLVPRAAGGRDVSERHVEIPWGEGLGDGRRPEAPWPGAIPEPGPALVHSPVAPAELHGACGHPLEVTEDGLLACSHACEDPAPAWLAGAGGSEPVLDYAGPWPVDERWWDPARHRRRAYMQIACPDAAFLVYREKDAWYEQAVYA
jgi:putative DNA repair polymerase